MHKKHVLPFLGVIPFALSACSGVAHNISEYFLKTEYVKDYRILQLTDVHLGDKDNLEEHFKFMKLTIDDSKPNLIVVTGDLFTFASKNTARRFLDFLDSSAKEYDAYWTVTFGNHDEQCYFSVDWLTGTLNNYGSRCLFKDIQDDDVFGNTNFAINLMKDNKIFEQLIIMDSNRYQFGDYIGYDYFKQDQIDWYKSLVNYTKEQNDGVVVPSLMFYHIPLPEINEAYDKAMAGQDGAIWLCGEKNEKSCPPDYNSGFFKVIQEMGSTTGMYFGHDHVNNFIVNYKGIDFAYGINSTDRIYFKEDMMGGRTIILHEDHVTEYEDHYHTYKEVK